MRPFTHLLVVVIIIILGLIHASFLLKGMNVKRLPRMLLMASVSLQNDPRKASSSKPPIKAPSRTVPKHTPSPSHKANIAHVEGTSPETILAEISTIISSTVIRARNKPFLVFDQLGLLFETFGDLKTIESSVLKDLLVILANDRTFDSHGISIFNELKKRGHVGGRMEETNYRAFLNACRSKSVLLIGALCPHVSPMRILPVCSSWYT